ncbi:unnamed protein product [Sphagnum jensenii]|uniref:Uncharacterized protein n=1 Tax=Sphagnum jensenii TaxID=128206 RepID=A0ABP1B2X2_9BRYO
METTAPRAAASLVTRILSRTLFALSDSWDGTPRLWDLNTGATTTPVVGHTKDERSVAFNRQILSGSRGKTIKLWNMLGDCLSKPLPVVLSKAIVETLPTPFMTQTAQLLG